MNKKGFILLAVIFMILAGFLGLSLLDFTLLHNKIIKARNIHRKRSEMLYNQLIFHLHNDMEKILNLKFNSALDDCSDIFNHETFPDNKIQLVKIKKKFKFSTRDFPLFKLTRIDFKIRSSSINNRHIWTSESNFKFISGNIPINFFPTFIGSGNLCTKSKNNNNDFHSYKKEHEVIPGHEIVFNIRKHISNIFGIEEEALTLSRLAEIFESPDILTILKDGIYFLSSDEHSGPVFVQGDTDQILISVKDGDQIIKIIQNNNYLEIRYSGDQFQYESEIDSGSKYSHFNEILIFNGNVDSLRSLTNPALAAGAHPELILLGNLKICSSIAGEENNGSGIPSSSITIISGSSPFSPTQSATPSLILDCGDHIKISGSINVNGQILNRISNLTIEGNIFCKNLKNSGNISVISDSNPDPLSNTNFFIKNFSLIKDFRTSSIEESYEDE